MAWQWCVFGLDKFPAYMHPAPAFDQPGHRRMQFEAISLKSGAERSQKRTAVALILKAKRRIVHIAKDDHVSFFLPSTPVDYPLVQYIAKEDVRQQGRDHRTLRGAAYAGEEICERPCLSAISYAPRVAANLKLAATTATPCLWLLMLVVFDGFVLILLNHGATTAKLGGCSGAPHAHKMAQ